MGGRRSPSTNAVEGPALFGLVPHSQPLTTPTITTHTTGENACLSSRPRVELKAPPNAALAVFFRVHILPHHSLSQPPASPLASSKPTTMQIKGYKVLGVPLGVDASSPFSSFLYVRQHSSKGYVRPGPLSLFPKVSFDSARALAHAHLPYPNPTNPYIARRIYPKDGRSSWPMSPRGLA